MNSENFVYEDNNVFFDNDDTGLVWPWLSQQQNIPHPDDFLSIQRGPIVHEGFVPDVSYQDEELLDPALQTTSFDGAEASDADLSDRAGQQPVDDDGDDPDFNDIEEGMEP